MALQIEDPLVEQLYAVLVGKAEGSAIGAVNRLQTILGQYYAYGSEPLPARLNEKVSSTLPAAEENPCSLA